MQDGAEVWHEDLFLLRFVILLIIVLEEIFLYLAPIHLPLSHLQEVEGLTDSNQLWVQACKNEFKISIPSSSDGLAQRFYKSGTVF